MNRAGSAGQPGTGSGAEPTFRQSIRMAEALWLIACRHGLGRSSRSEYRRQFDAVLARFPALAPPAAPLRPRASPGPSVDGAKP